MELDHPSGIGRTTPWQRWTMALLKIAVRLDAAAEQNCPDSKASDEMRALPAPYE